MCISFAGRAMSLVSVKNIWFPLQFNHTLQIQIRLVRQWSDPTLEQTTQSQYSVVVNLTNTLPVLCLACHVAEWQKNVLNFRDPF